MPRKNKNSKAAPATPAAQPGSNDSNLPAEVLQPAGSKSALDRASERDQLELLTQMRRELGASGGMATFRRRNPLFGISSFQSLGTQLPVKEVTPENLALMYGGGDFEIRLRSGDGAFDRQVTVSIDHSIKPKNPLSPEEKKETAPPVDVVGMMREFRESQPKQNDSALVEIVKAAMARPEPKGEAAAMLEMIKDMREEARRSEERFLKMMEKMSERNQPEAPRSLIEQIRELRELSEELGIGGDGRAPKEESFGKEFAKGLLEVGKPLLAQYFGGGAPGTTSPVAPQRLTQPVVVPSPSPSTSTPEAPAASAETGADQPAATPSPTDDMNHPFFNFALKRFQEATMQEAAKGPSADAFGLVDGMLKMVPDNMRPLVFKTTNSPDWFTSIFGTVPAAMNHTKFIEKVRDAILEKAFVSHCVIDCAQTPRIVPEQTARDFLAWVDVSFRDYLADLSDDVDEWANAFDGAEVDPAWLEQVRASILKILEVKSEPAKVVPMPPIAPATSASRRAGNGAPAARRAATKAP